jgi:hypothetical protein
MPGDACAQFTPAKTGVTTLLKRRKTGQFRPDFAPSSETPGGYVGQARFGEWATCLGAGTHQGPLDGWDSWDLCVVFRRIAVSPYRRIAVSPCRRIAVSPCRRIAVSPYRRIAVSPYRRIAVSPCRRVAASPCHPSRLLTLSKCCEAAHPGRTRGHCQGSEGTQCCGRLGAVRLVCLSTNPTHGHPDRRRPHQSLR